jgi:hypothetical protein
MTAQPCGRNLIKVVYLFITKTDFQYHDIWIFTGLLIASWNEYEYKYAKDNGI